jgi:ABC-type transporter Mla subunit MlaD
MRRIGLFFALLAAIAGTVVASAGADDKRTYQAELFNAFGLVEGSELRVGGVTAGTITDLGITERKTALVTFEVQPEFPEFTADATCSSEPQSLIAEYFLDCQPGTAEEPLEGPIEAARNQTTVQQDLVQNTLREPFKRRLQLILNEFGTGLAGNGEALNDAIRAGAPALRELSQVLKTMGRQNRIIAGLNSDADAIFARLAERREDVVRFIDTAEDTARISSERREDLARDFDLLDDFLFELRPVMVELGNLAREQTPLLTDLYAAGPGLAKLGENLPKFNDGARVSLKALGRASDAGRRALTKGEDEIEQLQQTAQASRPAADVVAGFLESLDDPTAAVEEDARARTDLADVPGEADRRVGLLNQRVGGGVTEPGYTGLEGLLNYVYYQTLALNQFDQVGHLLHFILMEVETSPCHDYNAGPTYPNGTTNPAAADLCAALLGNSQPGINVSTPRPRYDGDSVCPQGSTDLSLCDPGISTDGTRSSLRAAEPQGQAEGPQLPELPEAPELPELPELDLPEQLPEQTDDVLDILKRPDIGVKKKRKKLREQLGLKPGQPLPDAINDALGDLGVGGSGSQSNATGLLNFLLGP